MSSTILGLDVAFATFGFAAARVDASVVELVGVGVIRTKPGQAALLKSEDNFQRMRELYRALEDLRERYAPGALAVESQSWPRNAGAVAKIAMAWGVVGAFAALWDLPVIHRSPQHVKKHLTGKNDASKDEVRERLSQQAGFGKLEALLEQAGIPRSFWEHPSDAAAVIYAALDTEQGRLLRRVAA